MRGKVENFSLYLCDFLVDSEYFYLDYLIFYLILLMSHGQNYPKISGSGFHKKKLEKISLPKFVIFLSFWSEQISFLNFFQFVRDKTNTTIVYVNKRVQFYQLFRENTKNRGGKI